MHMNVSSNIKGFLMFGARTLSAAALFAAFAAQGDMVVGPWSRPNDYNRFLQEYAEQMTSVIFLCACVLVPLGICLLARFSNRRFGKKPMVVMECVVLGVLGLAGTIVGWMVFGREVSSRVGRVADSPKLRAEYDQKCIDYYDTHDWSPRRYRWESDRVPSIREGAPEAVTNAYRRYRYRVHSANAEIHPVTHGGE